MDTRNNQLFTCLAPYLDIHTLFIIFTSGYGKILINSTHVQQIIGNVKRLCDHGHYFEAIRTYGAFPLLYDFPKMTIENYSKMRGIITLIFANDILHEIAFDKIDYDIYVGNYEEEKRIGNAIKNKKICELSPQELFIANIAGGQLEIDADNAYQIISLFANYMPHHYAHILTADDFAELVENADEHWPESDDFMKILRHALAAGKILNRTKIFLMSIGGKFREIDFGADLTECEVYQFEYFIKNRRIAIFDICFDVNIFNCAMKIRLVKNSTEFGESYLLDVLKQVCGYWPQYEKELQFGHLRNILSSPHYKYDLNLNFAAINLRPAIISAKIDISVCFDFRQIEVIVTAQKYLSLNEIAAAFNFSPKIRL